ncbi:MAG: PLP-dependent aminotransferase family protein [Anaerolineae bacterium]|nr:PLP-dependent aminotransferase family protein [Anaerolineae bacterium]
MFQPDLPQGTAEGTISLLFGHPDPSTLLTPAMRDALNSAMNSPQFYGAFQYGPEQGTRALIKYLVDKLNREQQLGVQTENVMITAGSTGALDMVTRLFAPPNSIVLVEAPSYADSLHVLRDHHVRLRGIPMDDQGLIVTELERILAELNVANDLPIMLYTIPNYHNPTGITLAESRRVEILNLADRYGFLIVEDDVYHDLGFESTVPSSFYALADGKSVLSIGSFSKTFAPGLRVGWLVADKNIIDQCVNCGVLQMGGGSNPFSAQVIAEFCSKGYLEPHIETLRAIYKQRCEAALTALSRYMPSDVRWTHPRGGFFLWLTLPPTVLASEVKRVANERGLNFALGEGFFIDPADGRHNLRIAFSFAALPDLERGLELLAQVIETVRRHT